MKTQISPVTETAMSRVATRRLTKNVMAALPAGGFGDVWDRVISLSVAVGAALVGGVATTVMAVALSVIGNPNAIGGTPATPPTKEKIERFEVLVDTSNPNRAGAVKRLEKDHGLIMLPAGYAFRGSPTKLVIYCHSGGGTVTDTHSESENDNYCRYLVSLGYAVMDMAGMPKTFSDRLEIDYGRCIGSFVAVRSYGEGYNYAVKRYNVDPRGCFMFCNSNGGLVSLNLGNLSAIPIIAQAGICPLLSIKLNAWQIPTGAMTGGGFKSLQNRANIIRIYGMADINSQSDLNNAVYEQSNVRNYDPYEYILNTSKTAYPIPYKFFQPKDDPIVNCKLTENLVNETNKKGGNMILRSFDTGGHNPEPAKGTVGSFCFMQKTYPLTPTVLEVAKWFQLFGGYPVK